ncbi:unnamed protein product [Effrenium voratum]|nr:unnamed protein product [Effrenium voratum]
MIFSDDGRNSLQPSLSQRHSNAPPRQGVSMIFSDEDARNSLRSDGRAGSLSQRNSAASRQGSLLERDVAPLQSAHRESAAYRSSVDKKEESGASQTEGSEEWCNKTPETTSKLRKEQPKPGVHLIVVAKTSQGLSASASVTFREERSGAKVGSMAWAEGNTLHLHLPQEPSLSLELPDGRRGQVQSREGEQEVFLAGATLVLQLRRVNKQSKKSPNKKDLTWSPEVMGGRSFRGSNRRNTPYGHYVESETSDSHSSGKDLLPTDPDRTVFTEKDFGNAKSSAADPRASVGRTSDDTRSSVGGAMHVDPRASVSRPSETNRYSVRSDMPVDQRASVGRASDANRSSVGDMPVDPRASVSRPSETNRYSVRSDMPVVQRASVGRASDANRSSVGDMPVDPRASDSRPSDANRYSIRSDMPVDQRASVSRASDANRSSVGDMHVDPRASVSRPSETNRYSVRSDMPVDQRASVGRASDANRSSVGMPADPRASVSRPSDTNRYSVSWSDMPVDPRASASTSDARSSVRSDMHVDPRATVSRPAEISRFSAVSDMPTDSQSDTTSMQLDERRPSAKDAELSGARGSGPRGSSRSSPRKASRRSASSRRSSSLGPRSESVIKMQQDPSGSDTSGSRGAESIGDSAASHFSMESESGSSTGRSTTARMGSGEPGAASMLSSDSERSTGSAGQEPRASMARMPTILESESRASRSSSRSGVGSRASQSRASQAKLARRGLCRFTAPEAANFCGLEISRQECSGESLTGRDRTALLVLLEQAEHSTAAVRARRSAADAAALPRLLVALGSELSLHGREWRAASNANGVLCLGREPVLLAVLGQLIEVLDTLVPADKTEETEGVTMGGEAKVQYTESVLESLRTVLGPHGFLPETLQLLSAAPHASPGAATALRNSLLAALRLALAWEVPSTVQKPLDNALAAASTYQVALETLEALLRKLRSDAGPETANSLVAQLALTLDIIVLLLRSDAGLQRFCDSSKARGSDRRVSPLAKWALEAIELLAEHSAEVSIEAINTALPAAVCILSVLLDATPAALPTNMDQFVRALCQILSHKTLTLRLLSSLLQLVKQGKHRIWFGSVSDAMQTRKKLRQSLIRNKVPSLVAVAAKEKLEGLLQADSTPKEMGPVSQVVQKRASQVIAAGAYYDTVEALVQEVYGSGSSDVDEEMADLRNAFGELDGDSVDERRRSSGGMLHALSNMRQAILENCLMPQTRRRTSKVI